MANNVDNKITKIICEWIQFIDIKENDAILSYILDTKTIPLGLETRLQMSGDWLSVEEQIPLVDVPQEFEKYIERVVRENDMQFPKFENDEMMEEYLAILQLISAMFVFHLFIFYLK